MVARAIDHRRNAVAVYGTQDGRQWVAREDYESLVQKATLTLDECHAVEGVCLVIGRLLEHATALTADEKARVSAWLAAVGNVVLRLTPAS